MALSCQCARESLAEEDRSWIAETSHGILPVINEPGAAKGSSQPKASLAWSEGDLGCEA